MSSPWEPYEPWRARQGELTPAEEEQFRADLETALASGTLTVMPPVRDVVGYCPMGCGPRLHVMSGGMIMCLAEGCPDPSAVTAILSERETLDVVTFDEDSFNVLHPLRERIGRALLTCPVAAACARLSGPPDSGNGQFRAWLDEDKRLILKRIEETS
jgi:hypothetical protein